MHPSTLPTCVPLVMLTLLLTGCITETSGGMPGPAPQEERVAAQLDLARGYLERRDFQRAQTPLEKALEIDPRNVSAHVLSAVALHAQREFDLAERHYRTALSIEPKNPQALYNYSAFLTSRERPDDAIRYLETLVDDTSYRARAQAFESLGLAYRSTGDDVRGRAALERALQLNNRLPRANLELAELAFAEGDLRAASSQLGFYDRVARPSAKSLCLGWKLARAANDSDQIASTQLALRNLFPEQAEQCLKAN